MPEEKKDSFTFSDKIKNSKPAGSKSFAKSSAKIGRDGKPKATLLERTRRDAPFFIAALVALLLLPFLYKYSGQATEDQTFAPGMESAEFDPERYGFDTAMVEDPDGQIAQLAGRDSLSLIKGWGSNQEEDYARDDMDLDASSAYEGDASGEYSAERRSSSEMDVEENTTNIYKRRARAGTRAAFRRTQIGTLNPAGLRRPGGSRLGINNWGGSLKDAARKVGSGPREAPKPVSLQPLRAAGPARSSFGQGAAQAARKGLDNMGKADAVAALRDAYVKPVGPSRAGGIDLFADGRAGGGGKLDHRINIGKGETPWWWDMMKTRMQEEWMERFKRKWNWIKWMDKLAQNILGNLANCLITGDSDGDVDHFLGSVGVNSTVEATCCGIKKSKWAGFVQGKDIPFDKPTCDGLKKNPAFKEVCSEGWKSASGGGANVGFIGQRLCCLGICTAGAYTTGELGLNGAGMDCADMPNYNVIPSGQARKWNIYTYVVARNYFPEALKNELNLTSLKTRNGRQNLLCASMDRAHGGSSLNHADITGGVGYVKAQQDAARQHVIAQSRATANVPEEQQEIRERTLEVNQEALGDSCVIVVSRGNVLPYEAMKNKIMDLFKELGANEAQAEKAFYQLDLMYVSSFAAKNKLAYAQWFESGHHLKGLLPMPYWEFRNAYIEHKKITHKKDGSRDNVYNKKRWRIEGVDMKEGPVCYYDNLNFECGPEDTATAQLHFKQESFKGGSGVKPSVEDVQVSAEFRYLDSSNAAVEQPMINPDTRADNGFTFTYTFSRIYESTKVKKSSETLNPEGLVGNIIWRAQRGKQKIEKVCPLNLSGDGYTRYVRERACTSPQQSPKCCDELMGATPHHWDANKPVGSQCVDDTPVPPVDGKMTRLAPVLSWVPFNGKVECREEANNATNPTEKVFGNCGKVPGIVKNQDQNCGSQIPLMMDSQAAATFVQDVVKQYNAKNPNAAKKLSDKFYANKYPTDGEFVDALFIAKELGITQVPSSAVCELARDFVRMSKDPHAGNMPVAGSSDDFKGLKRYYRNELGAFLAYVHPTSILYPNKYYGKEMSVCDWRFLPEPAQCSGRKSTMKMGKAYYFNYYNDSKNKASLSAYLASFDDVKIPKTYPLAQLVQGHADLAHNCPSDNCASTRSQYNKDNYFGLMISDTDATDNQGNACVAFAGNATMSVDKALEYVQTVCKVGLDAKPYGNQYSNRPGPKNYVNGQTFTRSTTSQPGNDGSTQKQSGGQGRG